MIAIDRPRTRLFTMRRALLVLILVALVPMMVLLVSVYADRYRMTVAAQRSANMELARDISFALEGFVREVGRMELYLGLDLTNQELYTPDQAKRLMVMSKWQFPAVRAFSWALPSGDVVAASDDGFSGFSVAKEDFFRRILAGEQLAMSDLRDDPRMGGRSFVIAQAIRAKGADRNSRILGVVIATIDPDELGKLALRTEWPADVTFALYDKQDNLGFWYPPSAPKPQAATDQLLAQVRQTGAAAAGVLDARGDIPRMVAARVPVPQIGWTVGVDRPYGEIVRPILSSLVWDLAWVLAIAAGCILAATAIAHRIGSRLGRLQEQAAAIGRGDLAPHAPVTGIAELAELSSTFQQMAANLAAGRDSLQRTNEELEDRVFKRTQELRGTSLYARSLIEASLDPLVTISPEGKITDVNRATEEATGLSRARLIGTDFADYFTEPDKAREGYQKVIAEGPVHDYPLTIRHASGRTMDVLYNATVYRNEAGDVQGVFAAARDVTEQTRLEAALHAASLYARSLIEASLDPLVTISPEGKITDVNRATEEATGRSRDRLIGTDFADYFTEPDKAREGYQKVIAEGMVHDYPLTIRRADGRTMDVLYNATVYRNEAGDVQGVFAAARDITERLAAEQELARHRQHLEDLVRERTAELQTANTMLTQEMAEREHAQAEVRTLARFPSENPSPVLRIGQDMVLNYANKAAEPLLAAWGVREGEAVPSDIRETATAALASGKPAEREVTAGGQIISLIFSSAGEASDINVYGREITVRVRALEDLRKTADELARSNQDLEQFAYVASHDLQEPLRIVAGYLQLLERRYKPKLDTDAEEFIAFAVDGAHRMQDLINDLLAYSRIGTQAKPFEPTDTQTVLDRCMADLRPAIQESGAVITHGPMPTVTADATQMVQLFQNLLSNAIKFRGAEPPQIHVWAERQDGRWLFRIRDNGIGIDPQYAERIFVIFQRLHGRDKYPGTGIGLAVCKRIVERHGGKIWVESKPGSGSTFCFTI